MVAQTIKKILIFLAFSPLLVRAMDIPTQSQNNPYVDDRLYHFGFSLGINLMSYRIVESLEPIDGEVYYARVKTLLPGFSVGLVSDLRLSKYLNLRFLPALNFSNRTINYRTASGNSFPVGNAGSSISVLSLPLDFPLFLKWTAVREKNYRPYFTVGGGMTVDVYRDKQLPVLSKPLDAFVGVGAGCNIYLPWFRLCPEIRYQVGFNNIIMPVERRSELQQQQKFYTQSISRMYNQMLVIIFNFE